MRFFWLLAIAALQLTAARAATTEYAFTKVPSRFQTRQLTASARALGETCASFDVFPDGTVCNPAFLPDLEAGSLTGRVFLGNGYAALATANSFIYQPLSQEFLQQLFQKQNVTSLEAHAGLVFTSPHFSASFSPYRVQYTSEVHNPNFPVMALHAAAEKSLDLAGGFRIDERLSAGLKLRFVQRDYVNGTFSLFQAISDNPRNLLPTRSQTAIFLDPALAWRAQDLPWKPRVSMTAVNLGRINPEDPIYPTHRDLQLGFGAEAPVPVGRLNFGLDVANLLNGDEALGPVRFGAAYRYGMIEAMAGINSVATTVGLQFGLQILQAGIVYEFIRSDFEGGGENRIATEFAVRL